MGSAYSDARYGVEKILTFPTINLLTPNGTGATMYFTENIVLTELGMMVTTSFSTGNAVIQAKDGAGVLAALSLVTTTAAAGSCQRTATMLSASEIASADSLVILVSTAASSGQGMPYIKYRERFV